MLIQLEQAREQPLPWQETLSLAAAGLKRPEVVSLEPLVCEGEITFTGRGYLVQARLVYAQTLTCTRCLQPTRDPVSSELEVLVRIGLSSRERSDNGPGPLAEEDLSTLWLDEPILDTEPLVREQVELNLPMKPLCGVDCKGLCPQCGADLNSGPCHCPGPPADPRWAALAGLRQDLTGPEDS